MAPNELLRYPLVVVGSLTLPAQRRDVAGVAGRLQVAGCRPEGGGRRIVRVYEVRGERVGSGALTLRPLSRTSCHAL